DYLTKPFTDIELLAAIQTRLQRRDKQKNNSGNYESLDGLINEAQSAKLLTELSENSRIRSYKKKQRIY
ncbi:MAG TPA: transcriptional regulator, partial [Sphingobacteriaceae bacterium]|nr:transcriptional regulator [Sphingobacteriaceae bacterium]